MLDFPRALRHRRLAPLSAAAFLLSCGGAAAQEMSLSPDGTISLDTVTVTANATPTEASEVGSALTVVSHEELQKRQIRVVADALRSVPGVSFDRSGALGNLTQVRIRGAEPNQTLVLIDGIEVNDPALGSEFDFGSLLAYDVERIEVLRGPQSALYGSDAMGGVINIVTKRGSGKPHVKAELEGGSFGTVSGNASVSGGTDRYDFLVSGSGISTDGISTASEWRGNPEKDGYRNGTGFAKVGVNATDWLRLDFVGRYTDYTSEYDDFGTRAFDADFEAKGKQTYGRSQATIDLLGGRWQHILGAAYSGIDTDYFSYGSVSAYEGRKTKLDYQTNYFLDTPSLDAHHTFTFKAEHEEDSLLADTPYSALDKSIRSEGFVGQYQLSVAEALFVTAALRHDENDFFDDATTYRLTGAYRFAQTGTKIRASYGTAVKNPTLFELYGYTGSYIGNPNLSPETAKGWDVGIEQGFWDGRIHAEATYFEERIDDLIVGAGSTSVNLHGESTITGVELAGSVEPLPGLTVKASYTFMNPEDANGDKLIRRPDNTASLHVDYAFLDGRADVNLGVSYVGERRDDTYDAFYNTVPVTLDAYTLVDIAASYDLTDNAEIFGRVENLLDERYEEVFSYGTPGRAAYAGIRVTF